MYPLSENGTEIITASFFWIFPLSKKENL